MTNGEHCYDLQKFLCLHSHKRTRVKENHASTPKSYETCEDRTNNQLIKIQADFVFRYFDIFPNAKKILSFMKIYIG